MAYKDDPSNVLTEWDLNDFSCEHCNGTGWMCAFGVEVECNRHTWFGSLWLRYKANRLADGEDIPPEWLFVRWGEEYPKNNS